MKKTFLILLFLIGCFAFLNAQSIVSNTMWQMDENNEQVIVTYDLNRQGEIQYFSVELFGVLDGIEFKARSVSGDVGPYVRSGRNRKIVWDIFKDVAEANGSLSVKVVAENAAPTDVVADPSGTEERKNVKAVPVYAGLGGVLVLGGGLFVTGAGKSSNAKKEYDDDIRPKYEGIVGPDDSAYRQEYEDVNKRYKNGQLLMAGGGAVILVGGFILVKRLIDINKIKNTSRLDVQPRLELGGPEQGYLAGMSIRYRF